MPTATVGMSDQTAFTIANMSLSPGIYIVGYQLAFNATDAQYRLLNLYVNNANTVTNNSTYTVSNYQQVYYFTAPAVGQIIPVVSFVLPVTTTTTYYLVCWPRFGGNSQMGTNDIYFRATRIG
jgi:hypothetical protein